ncbi:gamma-glutamylcyclotransferase [Pseudoroseomonas deserti]|uniref:Gamma-glutamylcyclotransferase n=1 Tax=Teichococcus deserti TaxID=1817963 RepID=A0A1V2GV52_9PROT|nr:gamma-glutamylcyclotransferase [Pseudoroseomonas deserti]ONG44473.1 gamma-glutamylcyclotransferase [Pseudoroseomonas deserti]
MSLDHRLATYGTLAPGRVNHHELDGLAGQWRQGVVRGWLVAEGWGAALGYPALVPDPAGGAVAVHLFESADLPAHWPRLDDFEGEGYRRVEVPVETAEGTLPAWIYVAA